MRVAIIASGRENQLQAQLQFIKEADLVIAADGGANTCANYGIVPNLVLGDLDSITADTLDEIERNGVEIIRHPVHKDATDLELALDLAMTRGGMTVHLYGVLGGRWDMSFANVMLAAAGKYRHQSVYLYGEGCILRVLHASTLLDLSDYVGKTVSLLPLGGDVRGVTLEGFLYPLSDYTISFGATVGVSNIIQTEKATVHHTAGILLCIVQLPGT